VSAGAHHTLAVTGSISYKLSTTVIFLNDSLFYFFCIVYLIVFPMLAEDGEVYTWGRGAEGQLGLGDTKPRPEPTALALKKVKLVIAGGNQSFAITQQNNV
jgi:hypothetical protein